MAVTKRDDKSIPAPFQFPPSQDWIGVDGNWSTFPISVGTPGQPFNVLAGTAASETYIPGLSGCKDTNCTLRGAASASGFDDTKSTSWSIIRYQQIYQQTGLSADGLYGFDSVALENDTSGMLATSQIIGALANSNFYLGQLGLDVKQHPSVGLQGGYKPILQALKEKNLIPSMSYGFTAGAYYKSPKEPASLTLGGYDQSRFLNSSVTFALTKDANQSLSVPLQSIIGRNINTTNDYVQLLNTRIFTVIDSSLPELWLPPDVCDRFASEFGLKYDIPSKTYLANNGNRTRLHDNKATLTFQFGNNVLEPVSINVSYDAFDLFKDISGISNQTAYFPIKRALNEGEYTIGRALLQELYIVVDHERSVFSVNQVKSPSTPQIQPIISPDFLTSSSSTGTTPNSSAGGGSSSSLSSGAKAGVAIASIIIFASIAFAVWWWFFRLRQRDLDEEDMQKKHFSYEIGGTEYLEAGVMVEKHELPGTYGKAKPPKCDVYEIDGAENPTGELDTGSLKIKPAPMEIRDIQQPPQELPA